MWNRGLLSSSILHFSLGLSCYECEVLVNHLGNMVGSGYASCFDNPSMELSVECPSDSTRCQTDMTVEWYFVGEQIAYLKRGCAPKERG